MTVDVREHEKFENVYWVILEDGSERLATKNLARGQRVYGEKLVEARGEEYRLWDYYRSKLAAAIIKGLPELPIKPGTKVLYLGAASGTTASHVSDIVAERGLVYAIEFSPRVIRQLLNVSERRRNLVPILADATKPETYRVVVEEVDVIYQDVAQPEQARIMIDNANLFLRSGGYGILMVKARSIDVTKDPKEVFEREIKELEEGGFKIIDIRYLDPYDKDHAAILARWR